uniref:Zinc finger BED domain-containing protein RICESLEEPER 2-like n=1 Tax=Nelumbo nucifera TaxID=4432 RepID=A0A822XVK0_NELNU|nr:TPA_asm: hypothetical protein HUJ06_024582 [Nelumbo nucifera]
MVVDCPTRWNSTYDMLDIALELKEAFCRLAELDRDYKYLPFDEEWEMGAVLRDCLQVSYICTKNFSSTTSPTSNVYFPDICTIKFLLLQWLDSEHEYVRSMANRMKQKYDKYWDECSLVFAIAVVLDPKFKMEIVTYYYNLIYGETAEKHVTRVREAMHDLYSEYVGFDTEDRSLVCSSIASQPLMIRGVLDILSGFDRWLIVERPKCCLGTQKLELDLYLEEKLFPRGEEFDILRFWRVDGLKFPKLSRLAHNILAFPVPTVSYEGTFSTGGRIVD